MQCLVHLASLLFLIPPAPRLLHPPPTSIAECRTEILMFAHILKISEMQALTAPSAADFVILKKLELMSPNISHYVKKSGADSPSGIVKSLIQDHASQWGITSEQIGEKTIWSTVMSHVHTHLTDQCYSIKKAIFNSLWVATKDDEGETTIEEREDPLDIIKLCEELVNIVPDADMKVTMPMLACVAILRQIIIDVSGSSKFWEKVDEELATLHNEPDGKILSKNIVKVLKADCCRYGNPDLALFQ
ncbi:hypothetical protein B0H10DRAFT_2250924 [Mycena sp. CBHHK59/15]|nr:hypothetical protein B0H10DRAFT_2250924 [Mycena sp. CBHHK59/15]